MRLLKTIFVLILVAGFAVAFLLFTPYGPRNETFVDIPPGRGTAGIGTQLQEAGVLRSGFELAALRVWRGGTLKAGEYRFDHPATPLEVYERLRRGDVYTVSLVVPEGYNIFDIAAAVQAAGLGSKERFLAAERQHVELIAEWSPKAASLEGFLFPDTYRFSRHATPVQMLEAMVKRFGQVADRVGMAPSEAERAVTLASLVEREVHVNGERATVAGVFENRLRAGMPLQTDPAVIYASMLRGTWTGTIHQSELHSDSPYNTYTHPGLPPGPICNPGTAALEAAIHPTRTDFLYFVANPDGSTHFARELAEHQANVAAYRAGTHQK
ncbi:MAG TPA: endolytic transglycosylase MltG [Acidobacteriaceae bacterium]|nr:endolytic transglycosylase MltG [Acidobacteriaceae bacterium]